MSRPDSPSTINSGTPPTPVATIGRLHHIASITESGEPSKSDDSANTSSCAISPTASARRPRNVTAPCRPSEPTSASSAPRSEPSPISTSCAPGNDERARPNARMSTSSRFCGRRPATAPTTSPSGGEASSDASAGAEGAAAPMYPFGITRITPAGTRSISIMRARSRSETATNAELRPTTWRSRNARAGCPSYDHVCSVAMTTGVRAMRPRALAQRFEPKVCACRMSTGRERR